MAGKPGLPRGLGGSTAPQANAGPVAYPRGRVLGGSSAINALAHVRGHHMVYDGWASDGADGWSFADRLPCFRRSERADGRDPALRGTGGPIRVAPATDRHPVAQAFAEALSALGVVATDDLSGRRPEGIGWADLAIAAGQRVSAADGYLRPALDRPNLTVETGCLVTGLILRHLRCAGVSFRRAGAAVTAEAAGEVILCAGAIGSPQILMLSGIGPADPLRALGLKPVADLPGVGGNLQDHPVVMTTYRTPAPLPVSRYNHGEVYSALRSDLAGSCPDLQLFPILLPLAPAGCEPPPAGYNLVASVVAPDSRGSVRLATAAPETPPVVDPALLRDGRDVDRLEAGLRIVHEAGSAAALSSLGAAEVWPGPAVGTDGLRAYIRRVVGSYYHPAGTCRMGRDAGAVVDPELRVRGVTGVRVADASVLPVIPNAPLNATVLAVAERAAELIPGSAVRG